MARVAGRIKFLVVSISTIKGIKTGGVLCGIKWASMYLGVFNQPSSIKPNQIGSDMARVTLMWLEVVNVYGVNPSKLVNRINVNIETTNWVTPLGLAGAVNKESSE
jgi:hypothetical protein